MYNVRVSKHHCYVAGNRATIRMNYYQLIDVDAPGRWQLQGLWDRDGTHLDPREFCCGKVIPLTSTLEMRSREGRLVAARFPLRVGLRNSGTPLDFTFASFAMPVVTAAVADILMTVDPDAVQVLPVMVDGRRDESYIVNVTSRLRCIDAVKSDLELWTEADGRPDKTGTLKAVYGIVVDRQIARGHHLFRAEGWEVALMASDAVKAAFQEANVTGVEFLPA